MSISIFAKPPSRARRGRHLQRVSSIIRGIQIAQYTGAKLNPESGFENDACIYVKPHVKAHEDFVFSGHPYLDIIDGWGLRHLVQKHKEVPIITCSYHDFQFMSEYCANTIYLIPQHHCNFERKKRTRTEVTRVGCIGTQKAFDFLPEELLPELKNRNMELVTFAGFETREEIQDFYLNIDVQIVWRPYMRKGKIPLSNPLKIVNASSFGVPTIALEEPAFTEMSGCYYPVNTYKEFFMRLDQLRTNKKLYEDYSNRCLTKAETYHIEKIAKLYSSLR